MKFHIILLILLSIPLVQASAIHGTIYDLSLNPVKNVLIEVNSQPSQTLVSKDGAYSFSLPKGEYVITAKTLSKDINATTEEKISIVDSDGNYILDLFLLPETEAKTESKFNLALIIIPALITLLIISYFYLKKKKPKMQEVAEDESLDRILKIIKDVGGRITQKDLRKHFPLSEAKVSLMITELESKGKIEKIKKGRGNIIILK